MSTEVSAEMKRKSRVTFWNDLELVLSQSTGDPDMPLFLRRLLAKTTVLIAIVGTIMWVATTWHVA